MKRLAIAYGLVLALMLAFDFVWLSATAETLYRPAMHGLMREGFGWRRRWRSMGFTPSP